MAENATVTYVKLSSTGEVIEREAATPRDHVQFKGTGWVVKDSSLGRQVTGKKKASADGQSASSVTAHAAAAQTAEPANTSKPSAKTVSASNS